MFRIHLPTITGLLLCCQANRNEINEYTTMTGAPIEGACSDRAKNYKSVYWQTDVKLRQIRTIVLGEHTH